MMIDVLFHMLRRTFNSGLALSYAGVLLPLAASLFTNSLLSQADNARAT